MTKAYFGCSKQGGHGNVSQKDLREVQKTIQQAGIELVFDHTSPTFRKDDAHLTAIDVHDRDFSLLRQSELGIFEISNPSLGVGGEISDMLAMGKPVICLFKRGLENSVSAYILGKQGSKFVSVPYECHPYNSPIEASQLVRSFADRFARK